MKRRLFLQFAGTTLATLGLSQTDFLGQADRVGRVLAQGTPRKLALLVGINHYPEAVGALNGCLTDVRLQKHLLIHRFGFNPADVIELSDDVATKPTRANILDAFENHLIKQAKPGDVVVFHYSGHGDRIRDPNPLNTPECREIGDCNLDGTIVPNDATLERRGSEVAVPDIMGRTLFLLMRAIQTESLTVVLDSCHSGAGTRGNARVRAARARASAGEILVPSAAELQTQAALQSQLNLSDSEFQRLRQQGIANGVALGSAQRDQIAVDATFEDFSAGAFTYLLTRYLWQVTSPRSAEAVYSDLVRSTRSLAELQSNREQVPVFDYKPGSPDQQQPIYFTNSIAPAAEAVLTSTNPIRFWLGGVSSQNLQGTAGTIFSVMDAKGTEIATIEQSRRRGLDSEGHLVEGQPATLREGMLLRERIIGLPSNPTLNVGIDASLGHDAGTAQTELAASRVKVVKPQGAVDCLLGRFTEAYQQRLKKDGVTDLPLPGSIGLFQPDLTPLTDSFGPAQEAASAAISRLRPRFKQILARQLLSRLLAAGSGSPLRVAAKVLAAEEAANSVQVMSRGASETHAVPAANPKRLQFRSGTNLQVEIHNLEPEQDLYLSILVIGANGAMDVVYPAEWIAPEEAARISRGDRLTMPRPQDQTAFKITGAGGFPELLILVSQKPLRQALSAMQQIARGRGSDRGFLTGLQDDEPLDILDQLLGDLNNLSRSVNQPVGPARTPTTVAYNTATLAVLSVVFEVVK